MIVFDQCVVFSLEVILWQQDEWKVKSVHFEDPENCKKFKDTYESYNFQLLILMIE